MGGWISGHLVDVVSLSWLKTCDQDFSFSWCQHFLTSMWQQQQLLSAAGQQHSSWWQQTQLSDSAGNPEQLLRNILTNMRWKLKCFNLPKFWKSTWKWQGLLVPTLLVTMHSNVPVWSFCKSEMKVKLSSKYFIMSDGMAQSLNYWFKLTNRNDWCNRHYLELIPLWKDLEKCFQMVAYFSSKKM